MIADSRGVDPDVVRKEIEQRKSAQKNKRGAAEESLMNYAHKMDQVGRKIHKVKKITLEADGKIAPNPADLTTERRNALAGSAKALRHATPEERAGYLKYLWQRRERLAELRDQAGLEQGRELPAGHRYEEVAYILGRLSPNDDAATKTRVVNTITVKLKRIHQRLRAEIEQSIPDNGSMHFQFSKLFEYLHDQ